MTDTFSYEFYVTHDLLDKYGHVNNAKYLKLFEDARWAILQESGIDENQVRAMKTGPVILEVTVRFSNEITEGQKVIIRTQSRRKGTKLFYFDQVMISENGKIFSKATFTAALFDLVSRRMITPDEKWLKAFGFKSL